MTLLGREDIGDPPMQILAGLTILIHFAAFALLSCLDPR
jgi:hypothetical protein